ncbi:tetratricopeptide repeat protein [Bremerella sp. JC817]|uniref:tetratricopeptide repeat protein n=1 Tax=Bremerella sp. JC817 TaxID=3231756 RepID=UPI003457D500
MFIFAILIATAVLYHRTLAYPFHFDGTTQIANNPQLDSLSWNDFPTRTRQLIVTTWKLHRHSFGTSPVSFHVVNLFIHAVAGLALLGLSYRTLRLSAIPEYYRENAAMLSGAIALWWTVHPLQTQAVTYIIQRYESLMGMFFLIAVYCLAASAESSRKAWWYAGCIAATYLSGGCKEVAVVLPLVLIWYDRAFLSESWRSLVAHRWWLHLATLGIWVLYTGFLTLGKENFETHNTVYVTETTLAGDQVQSLPVSSWEYLLSQAKAIVFYLQLAIFPAGQSIDHGWKATRSLGEAILPGLLVLFLLGLTVWAIYRFPRWSFLGGWFFLVLAPTSSILPIQDIAVEHRMYVPLAAIAALLVLGLFEGFRRLSSASMNDSQIAARNAVISVSLLAVVFGGITISRNEVYQSALALWSDAAAKAPNYPRAQYGVAKAYLELEEPDAALPYLQKAVQLDPAYAEACVALGKLERRRNPELALRLFTQAVTVEPGMSEAHNNLGAMLAQSNPVSAQQHYQQAIALNGNNADAHNNLANLLARQGNLEEAIRHYEVAIEIRPDFPLASSNLDVVRQMAREAKAKPQ